jgi:hypothetical protein
MRTVAAALAALALAAPGAQVDLRPFVKDVARIARPTGVPIILPSWLQLEAIPRRIYAGAQAEHGGWSLEIASAPDCRHASACFVAGFQAERGGGLPGKPNATLPGEIKALYRPVSCGGSCAPANVWFVRKGVLYTFQVKNPPKNPRAALLAMAAQALRAGPR